MGLIPSRATQHLLNGAALPQVCGRTMVGVELSLISHQIRLSGHHHKGFMGKQSHIREKK